MTLEKLEKLTPEQDEFCRLYASDIECFGNGTRSYVIAYGLNPGNETDYKTAMTGASRNLEKPHIVKRINELLEAQGLNNMYVDKQLLFLISQHVDFPTKLQSIKEFNKMHGRIIDRAQLEVSDKQTIVEIVKQYEGQDSIPCKIDGACNTETMQDTNLHAVQDAPEKPLTDKDVLTDGTEKLDKPRY